MTDLESLPILALQNIFRFFDFAERQRFRRVSKKWKFTLETMRPQRDLCIYSHSYPFEEKWPFSNEEIACQEMIYCDPSDSSDIHKVLAFIGDLERLYLYWVHKPTKFFLWSLPLLNKLKVLIIHDHYSCFFGDEKLELQLLSSSSLEKLSITFTKPTGIQLDLETPSLHSLIVWESPLDSRFRFCYPLSIRYLQCVDFKSILGVCKNLQELVCQQISFPFDLNEYQSLRKVNIYPLIDDEHDTLTRLTEQRDRLHRESLQILVSGFNCARIYYRHVDSMMLLDKDNLEKLAANQSKLIEPIPWGCYLWFKPLYENFGKITKELPKIFSKIQTVEMGPEDHKLVESKASDVVNFLADIKVAELILEECNFKREFFELLPAVKSIKKLNITERSLASEDYALITKLKNLNQILVESEKISIDFVRKCLDLRFFEFLSFRSTMFDYFHIRMNLDRLGYRYRLSSNFHSFGGSTDFKTRDQLMEVLSQGNYCQQISFWI